MTENTAPTGKAPYLRIERLPKQFGAFTALKDISLEIYPGEFVCFLGPSGCGKTTLLRAIAGLDIQTSGRIFQADQEISTLPASQPRLRDRVPVVRAVPEPFRRRQRGLRSGQSTDCRRSRSQTRVVDLLQLVGLPESARKYPAQLSGGQQQRVAVARALALSPGLLLLDEPLSALDARVRAHLRIEIRRLHQRLGVTTIMVTHDQEEALTMADRIVVMNQGVIEQVGTPTEVYRRPATAFVADFVGTTNFLPAVVVGPGQVRFGNIDLSCELDVRPGAGHDVTVAIRPEDVVVRNVVAGDPNSFARARRRDRVSRLVLPCGPRDRRRRTRRSSPISRSTSCATWRSKRARRFRSRCRRSASACFRARRRNRDHRCRIHAAAPVAASIRATRRRLDRDDVLMRLGICLLIGWMLITLVLPLWSLLSKSFQNQNGEFVGLANYIHYFSTPALFASVWNSLFIALLSTAIVLPLAFVYAYALQRSCMRWKGLFQALALIPILAPSLLPAISLIYLFGNQGFLKDLMFGASIYGAGRHRDLAGLLLLPARAHDFGRGAVDGRCATLRGRRRAWRIQDARVLHGHPARAPSTG